MRRATWPILAAVVLACGGAGEPDTGPSAPAEPLRSDADGAPVIESVTIQPAAPSARDVLTASVRAYDPDGDPLAMEIEWYRNGQLLDSGSDTLEPMSLARGDRVFARARVTDGDFDVEEDSRTLEIVNAPPRVTAIRIEPPEATATDMLIAEVQTSDADEDRVGLAYRWHVNGELVAGAENARLAPGLARRGATVLVEVQPTDGRDAGEWRASDPYRMGNAAPAITTQPVYELSSSATYSYDVAATDPDGDAPLKYELIESPPGMQVDISSGEVTWKVPESVEGRFPIELVVSDPYGARTHQRYSLQVSWEASAPPASGVPAAGVAPPSRAAAPPAGDADLEEADDDEFEDADETPVATGAPEEIEPDDFEPDPIIPDSFDDADDAGDADDDDLDDDLEDDDEDDDDFDETPASDFEDDFDDDDF